VRPSGSPAPPEFDYTATERGVTDSGPPHARPGLGRVSEHFGVRAVPMKPTFRTGAAAMTVAIMSYLGRSTVP
jgi:hypothetical protein